MKRSSLFFIMILLTMNIAHATQSFSGMVETIKGEPIKHVKVSLQEKNRFLTTETDDQGKFIFKNISCGKYLLSAQKKDLLTFVEPTTIAKNDKPMEITMIPEEFAMFHYLPIYS